MQKLSFVLLPRQSSALLHQWDLWGPLFLITSLAILLQSNATKESNGVEFAQVFLLMLFGAIIVTVSDAFIGLSFSLINLDQFETLRWKIIHLSIDMCLGLLSFTFVNIRCD